jgi:4-carboxymuconolactone decarboxylase
MANDMTDGTRRFGPLSLEDMSPEQRGVADGIMAGPRARLTGPFEAMLCSPPVAEHAQRLGAHVRFSSSVPAVLNEMAIIMVGRKWTAQFEWHAHRRLALEAGLDLSIVEAIAAGRRPALQPGSDMEAVYDFVEQLLATGHVSDEAFDAVARRWGKQGAIDLIAALGYYTLVSFVLNVDRYPIPPGEPRLDLLPR